MDNFIDPVNIQYLWRLMHHSQALLDAIHYYFPPLSITVYNKGGGGGVRVYKNIFPNQDRGWNTQKDILGWIFMVHKGS